ncbi:RICIN domain-containing protein [Kitasatospora sp. NPDC056327]|uniref:RICIN domain-containing protein n=1 Tax=Kitasatospora sp. NPDC056327 TaxID=3345785 RepID=UPI0035DBE35F
MSLRTAPARRTGSTAAVLAAALACGLAVTAPAAHARPTAPAASGPLFSIANYGSEKCLEVTDWSTGNGATVRQWTCTGGANQQWYWTTGNELVNAHSGKCLDIPFASTEPGTQAVQWTCNGGTNQKWTDEAVSTFTNRWVNVNSNLVLDVAFGSLADGAPVIQWTRNAGPNQVWFPADFTAGP